MKFLVLPLVVFILAFVVFGCKKQTTSERAGAGDSLMIQYQALSDSIDNAWNIMIADDDEKHMLMKRLLLEVSYTNNYDKDKFQNLNQQVEALGVMRYDQETMRSSSLIDAYDSATWAVADAIILFARKHPRYEDVPIMGELINEINEKNNYVLLQRVHYDSWVKARNEFVEKNKDAVRTADPTLIDGSLPIFELPS